MAGNVLAFMAVFGVTLLAMLVLRPLAVAVDLVDKPGGRKTHHGDVPVVGGLAMFVGWTFGVGFSELPPSTLISIVSACALLVTVGLLDDRFDLSPWARLPLQIVAPIIVFPAGDNTAALSVGDPLGIGPLSIAPGWSLACIVVLAVGAINAFNMMDGMDGIAGSVAIVGCVAILIVCVAVDLPGVMGLAVVLAAAISAFLLFNLPFRFNQSFRCFMGDSGSTLLGFVLALLCLFVSQQERGLVVSPIHVLWFVALPIYELTWTLVRRLSRGQSPFRPDREHLHHLLLDSGLSVRVTFLIYVLTAILLALVGLVMFALSVADVVSFSSFVLLGAVTVFVFYRIRSLLGCLPGSMLRSDRSDTV